MSCAAHRAHLTPITSHAVMADVVSSKTSLRSVATATGAMIRRQIDRGSEIICVAICDRTMKTGTSRNLYTRKEHENAESHCSDGAAD